MVMNNVYIPESLPIDSQPGNSQRYGDYAFEPTQVSQPVFSQTQNTQGISSQVEPRRKYWALFIPTNSVHPILKLPWTKSSLQLGRGPQILSGNDLVLAEKRISNRHCRVTLGIPNSNSLSNPVQAWKDGEGEPEVWLEDLGSSNGTFVNGERLRSRVLLQHGDEVSLGHCATLDTHDVRYIFRSVGGNGTKTGRNPGRLERVGEVYERYQFLERLGKGTFAEVYRAVDPETGNQRAIKQIVKHRFAGNAKTLALFQREINICQQLQHEHICRLIEHYEDPQHICLVLEYVDGGDMLDYIMNWQSPIHAGLPEEHAADLTLQICSAMAYTHEMGVTHRDLKPENILLASVPGENTVTIKIADFGLAKMVDAKTMLTSMVGTPQYLAPEVVMQTQQNPGYENVVDSWSVGIIVYSMLTKALPFEENAELAVDKRIKARFTQQFDVGLLEDIGISANGIQFISRLLEKRPADRMTMQEALQHPWLAGPSTQHSDSSRLGLGGDSVWDIQSFPSDAPDPDEPGEWFRPPTVSGTNLESGLLGSDTSFSQPMEMLRLATPTTPNYQGAAPRGPVTPPTDLSLKRKKPDPFSSGSLSPVPPEDDITGSHKATDTSVSPRRSARPRKAVKRS